MTSPDQSRASKSRDPPPLPNLTPEDLRRLVTELRRRTDHLNEEMRTLQEKIEEGIQSLRPRNPPG